MKGSGSIYSKPAPWHFMKSLLTDPTLGIFSSLQLKNTFWRPVGSVSGTGINVILSPAPSRTSPGESFICSHPLPSAQPPYSPHRFWTALLFPQGLHFSVIINTPNSLQEWRRALCSYFGKTMCFDKSSLRVAYNSTETFILTFKPLHW